MYVVVKTVETDDPETPDSEEVMFGGFDYSSLEAAATILQAASSSGVFTKIEFGVRELPELDPRDLLNLSRFLLENNLNIEEK